MYTKGQKVFLTAIAPGEDTRVHFFAIQKRLEECREDK